jgi:large repetitive protein
LTYSGLGGDDDLTLVATDVDDTIVHTPGATADAGQMRVNSLLALDYVHLGAAGSVTVDGDDGDDTLVYLGSNQSGDFTVSAAGEVTYEDAVVHVAVSTTDVENLELDASASGTTLFTLNAGYPYDTVTLIGSNHSGSMGDVAQLNGDGTALTIAPTTVNDQIDVTGGGLGSVTLYGIENLEVDAGGGDVTYNGNAADNDVTVAPAAADAAGIAHAGLDAQINVAGAGSLLVDLLGGSNSLTVLGTQGDDTITVTGAQVAVNLLLPVDYLNVQSLSVLGGDGSDTFTVTPSADTSIFIDGGNPIGAVGDTLVLNAPGDATFAPGPESDEGGFSFAGALPVSYDHIEAVSLDLGGNAFTFLGTNGDDVITVVGTGADSYTISINDGPALAVTNAGDLTIDALAGDDRIVIDVNTLALGMVTVEGGQPQAAGDRLTVSGTDASWTPSTGALLVDGQPITVLGIETLLFDGESADGSLTVVGSGDDEVFEHTPGTALDAGHVAVTDLSSGTTQLGIAYVALGLGGTVTVDGSGGDDTLVAGGTQSSDEFDVAGVTGAVSLRTLAGDRVVLETTDVEHLTLDGLDGDDTFDVAGDHPYAESSCTAQGPGGQRRADRFVGAARRNR